MFTLADYEKKFTELSKYTTTIIASEEDCCKRFEGGLRKEIQTLLTACSKWIEFSKLVETTLKVERSLEDEKA